MDTELQVHEATCQTALNRLKRRNPYGWDLNIYRGCGHGCKYCYAIYSHRYLNDQDYFGSVHVKTNIAERLEQELSSPSWRREVINIGGVTDSYQPIEEQYRIMPEVLKLLIKYRTPAIISTKSDLVLRDYDLIDQLSRITYINVAATITTTNEAVRSLIEPHGCETARRFDMLREFSKTNASIGLHVMPIIPYITDSRENMEAICQNAQQAKVHYMLPGTLYLRGQTRTLFFDFIQENFPHHFGNLKNLYKTGGATKEYKEQLYGMVNELRDKYGISKSYSKPMREKMHRE